MVQMFNLPQKTNLGSVIGQGIGQGLGQGLQTSVQQQFNRGQLQNALQKAKSVASSPGASPTDIAFALMEAGAGIPGSEKYLGQLLPLLIGQTRANNIFGAGGGGNAGANVFQQEPTQNINPSPQMQGSSINQGQVNQQNSLVPNLPQGQINGMASVGGANAINPQVIPENEMAVRAQNMAIASGDPSSIGTWQDYLMKRNEEARRQAADVVKGQQLETERQADILTRDKNLRNFAETKIKGADSEEINDFMRIGQKYSNLNPSDWYEKTRIDFDQFMRKKTQFDKMFIPGALRGIYLGGEEREKELNRITPIAEDLIKNGKESYVRNKLADLGLTQTEVEKIIHPLDRQVLFKMNKLPQGVNPPQKSIKKILTREDQIGPGNSEQVDLAYKGKVADFLLENLGDNSLLALRDPFLNKKHYSWEQFYNGIEEAQQRGLKLNPSQQAELEELRNPPKDSIANIFRGVGNIVEFLRGSR